MFRTQQSAQEPAPASAAGSPGAEAARHTAAAATRGGQTTGSDQRAGSGQDGSLSKSDANAAHRYLHQRGVADSPDLPGLPRSVQQSSGESPQRALLLDGWLEAAETRSQSTEEHSC